MLGVTRGVMVSASAFLACRQCYCAGSSLTSGLESSALSMWHFLKLVARGFIWVLWFPPLLHQLMVQPQVARAQSCANHVQPIKCLSRAICRVVYHVVGKDSSAIKFDIVEIAFI